LGDRGRERERERERQRERNRQREREKERETERERNITIVMDWGKSTGNGRIILNFTCIVQFYGGDGSEFPHDMSKIWLPS
jgi:hypothetical protein